MSYCFKNLIKDLIPLSIFLFLKKYYKKFYLEKKINNYYLNTNISENDIENVGETWENRIKKVKSSSDNEKIPRHNHAGKLDGNLITMHNGLILSSMSYYGSCILKMLIENKGVHEPQEEFIFQEVLKEMPNGASMLELGAYWGFYSLWFAKEVKNANNFLLEPNHKHLQSAKINFRLNNLEANFFEYWTGSGKSSSFDNVPSTSVDKFIKNQKLDHVSILHSDIQGSEVNMLHNSIKSLTNKIIDYIFISTHSNNIHNECVDVLEQFDYKIVASANCTESFSEDGILVAVSPKVKNVRKIQISKNVSN